MFRRRGLRHRLRSSQPVALPEHAPERHANAHLPQVGHHTAQKVCGIAYSVDRGQSGRRRMAASLNSSVLSRSSSILGRALPFAISSNHAE